MQRAVFLDRDGVLNKAIVKNGKPYPPSSLSELQVLSGVPEALRKLKEKGFLTIVITNQPDVARGITTRATVEGINRQLVENLAIDHIFTCYHDNDFNCDCRKPKPGQLFVAAERFSIDLRRSFMIGDRWSDMAAGAAAACSTIFIDYGYQERQPDDYDYVTTSLEAAVKIILENKNE